MFRVDTKQISHTHYAHDFYHGNMPVARLQVGPYSLDFEVLSGHMLVGAHEFHPARELDVLHLTLLEVMQVVQLIGEHLATYDNQEAARGIDYDLTACLENNPQDNFELNDIVRVLAVWEGEHDGDHWRWIIETKTNYLYLNGWCDYTGWDCQSGAYYVESHSLTELLNGLGDEDEAVIAELKRQLNTYKAHTWDEKTSLLFKLDEGVAKIDLSKGLPF